MARRGLFAELQHQARVAARNQARAARGAERARNAAIRDAERARISLDRAVARMARASAAEQKRLEKEARDAHVEAKLAEVEVLNFELLVQYDEIDSLLAATMEVDDFVDLETLKRVAEHPPFARRDLEVPITQPAPNPRPATPAFTAPKPPTGLRRLLWGKRKQAEALAEANRSHESAVAAWKAELDRIDADDRAALDRHAKEEIQRAALLEQERSRYAAECSVRTSEVEEHNRAVEALITNLGYGTVDAVHEYVSIVLSNSVYPECFRVEFTFEFEPSVAELQLRVAVPSPETIPGIKSYKYTKVSDDITTTSLSQKACRDRYSGAVNQVALRSLHEIFEADRRGLIKTISLEVGTVASDPATGVEGFILFVAVGAERSSFLELNLANVVPAATLEHLGAAVSKNPFGLEAADASGVRRS